MQLPGGFDEIRQEIHPDVFDVHLGRLDHSRQVAVAAAAIQDLHVP